MVRRSGQAARRPFGSEIHLKPRLIGFLQALGLDVIYERGGGDHLYYRDAKGFEVEVLDLVGGYGSLLLGHAHPELVAEAQRFLASGRPIHAQGSIRPLAERLAGELSRRTGGDFRVVFANSGSEAVEAALKHAMLETGGRTFIALENAFHGKTLGALQLTANEDYRGPFALAGLNVIRARTNDLDSLESAFARAKDLAGFLFEPIQGEGGVWPLTPEFACRAAQRCAARGVPLIADECQTGLGRTGHFLACAELGVHPDYVILSKTLGGGIAKIAALLIDRGRYRDAFDLMHTSTYSEDDFSSALALKTLELLDPTLLERCQTTGAVLFDALVRLRNEFPDVVADARGRGLLLGLELRPRTGKDGFLLRYLSSREVLGFLIAGYLLHEHRIRIAPTLSQRFTLRLQPSALLEVEAVARVESALADVCRRLRAKDVAGLTAFLARRPPGEPAAALAPEGPRICLDDERFARSQQCVPSLRVAWLCHFIDGNDFPSLEPGLAGVPPEKRDALQERLAALAGPVVLHPVDVQSRLGDRARLYPILLPVTSRWMKHWLDVRQLDSPQALVRQGLEAARALGCTMVSLGQYTSIVTRNGTSLAAAGIGLTTGNSFAVALAVQALAQAHHERGSDTADLVVAVVGAAGNVGRTCAEMLAPLYRRVVLVGTSRPGSRHRLDALARRVPNAVVATDLAGLAGADTVVSAINAVDAPLGPDHFAPGAIVCDVSVPSSLQSSLAGLRPDLLLIQGGTVRLPGGEDLDIPGFPLPRGQSYGCMAEALLLGFEGVRDAAFTGLLSLRQVKHVEALARKHGFELADYKRTCVLGSQRKEGSGESER